MSENEDIEPTPPAAAVDAGHSVDPDVAAAVEALRADVAVDTSMSFRDAYRELQELVAELESDRADVDELTVKVARANALAAHCRARLTTTRMMFTVLETSTS